MDFSLSRATDSDVPLVQEIMREAVAALPRKDFFVDDDIADIQRHVERDGFILIARHGEDPAGFLMIEFPRHHSNNLGRDLGVAEEELPAIAHIDSACVRPGHRGRGLQKILVREAEAMLRRDGYRLFLATVHPDNVASLSSMLALGYRIGATKEKYGGLPRHILFKNAGSPA